MIISNKHDEIYNFVKKQKTISVPMLQSEFDMDYYSVKSMIKYFIERKWISEYPYGVDYKVHPEYMTLKTIRSNSVKRIRTLLNRTALGMLEEMHDDGKTDSAKTESDTNSFFQRDKKRALEMLQEEHIGVIIDNAMYLNIFRKSAELILGYVDDTIEARKRAMHYANIFLNGDDDSDADGDGTGTDGNA